jgi:hypothetical protein
MSNKLLCEYIDKPNPFLLSDIQRKIKSDHCYTINSVTETYLELFLSIVEFFNNCNINYLSSNNATVYILYIGSSKGYHLPLLFEYYKNLSNIRWYLYDIDNVCISVDKISYNVDIHKKIVDNEEILKFKHTSPLLFIHDFDHNINVSELLKYIDLQNKIIVYLSPLYSFTKFKYPKKNNWIINIDKYEYISTGIKYLPIIKADYVRCFINNKNLLTLKFDKLESNNYYKQLNYYNTCIISDNVYNYNIIGYMLFKSKLFDDKLILEDIINILKYQLINIINSDYNFYKNKK